MICKNCNHQCADTDAFCTYCGATLEKETAAPTSEAFVASEPVVSQPVISDEVNPIVQKWQQIFSHNLFLVMAILVSCSAVFSLFSGSVNVISILFTIFFWILFASAKKNAVSAKQIRWVSGTIYAQKVINWVLVGVLGFGAIISIFSTSLLASILSLGNLGDFGEAYSFVASIGTAAFGVIIAIALLIAAAFTVVVNILYFTPAHQIANSLYNGFVDVNKLHAVKTWSLVLGILSGVGALATISGGFCSFIASASGAAAYIIAYVWIDKITANA